MEYAGDRARKAAEAEASEEEEEAPAPNARRTGKVTKQGSKSPAAKPGKGKKNKAGQDAKIKVIMLVAACVMVLCLFRMPLDSPHIVITATMLSCAPLASHPNAC